MIVIRENIILVSIILILSIFIIFQSCDKKQFEKKSKKELDLLKEESKFEINKQFLLIDSIKLELDVKIEIIGNLNNEIDSVQKLKNKVIYINEKSKKDISSFDELELEKYWKDEL